MHGLIQKSGYIKPGGGAGNYAEYIATRDGVELINGSGQYMEYIRTIFLGPLGQSETTLGHAVGHSALAPHE